MLATVGLWVAATGIVALSFECLGAALVLFGIAVWMPSTRRQPQPSGAGFTKPRTIIHVRSLPTPARFRPLGPPMFDCPTIAS
jgi:hypothetical protein